MVRVAERPLTICAALFAALRCEGRWSLYLSRADCRFPLMCNCHLTEAPACRGESGRRLSAHSVLCEQNAAAFCCPACLSRGLFPRRAREQQDCTLTQDTKKARPGH